MARQQIAQCARQVAEVANLQCLDFRAEPLGHRRIVFLDVAVDQAVVETLHGDVLVGHAGEQDRHAWQIFELRAKLQPVHARHGVIHDDDGRLQEAVDLVDLAVDAVDVELDRAALGRERQIVVGDAYRQKTRHAQRMPLAQPRQRLFRVVEGQQRTRWVHLEPKAFHERLAVVDHHRQGGVEIDRQGAVLLHTSGEVGRGLGAAHGRCGRRCPFPLRYCLPPPGASGTHLT